MEYSLAVCLLDGRAGLAQYTRRARRRPRARSRSWSGSTSSSTTSIPVNLAFFPSVVTVTLDDGRELTAAGRRAGGLPERPLSEDEVMDQGAGLLRAGCSSPAVRRAVSTVLRLEELADVGVLGLCSSPPAATAARP